MLASFKGIFKKKGIEIEKSGEEYHLACAAILCEAASMDGIFDDKEKSLIMNLLQKQFSLDHSQSISLFEEAKNMSESASQLYGFTKIIKNSWDIEKKIRMLEMLWEVAYVDGNLDAAEDMLIRRIAGLIHVDDRDRIRAKQKILNKM
tara:strand:+ start:14775 stop:15218 length:444 start_codon:yes stop_codon:yes gene_type:complete